MVVVGFHTGWFWEILSVITSSVVVFLVRYENLVKILKTVFFTISGEQSKIL